MAVSPCLCPCLCPCLSPLCLLRQQTMPLCNCGAEAAPPPPAALLLLSCACSAVYTLGYTLLPASCCEFHFRCDILLQNFIFNLCTYYTACHAPFTVSASRSLFLCVCSTYLAFVFIFSVIVLFLPCHGNSCSSSPSPIPRLRPCVHATYHLWIRTVHSPRQAHAVDYYYEHYDRISLTAQNVSCASCCW